MALEFNHTATGEMGNLFATVGGNSATVYDDEHFGDYIAIVSQFVNEVGLCRFNMGLCKQCADNNNPGLKAPPGFSKVQ